MIGEQVWKADNRTELQELLKTMDYDKPLIFQVHVCVCVCVCVFCDGACVMA